MVKEYQGFLIEEKEIEFISSITPYLNEPIQLFLPNAGNATNYGFVQENHIIELRLRGSYERIPETITNLTKIKSLSLSSMNLTGFPEILAKLESLEFLSITFIFFFHPTSNPFKNLGFFPTFHNSHFSLKC